ncbi:branched-chain amino acid ABC transporter permease [Noviherbaspirillum denitrificans]|uniref:ABC transporter permease n=1 Tax=Noviherbaspirillum denitrificans TaxID=1968433 RepID=A0A254TH47_9BURK|nr:branched-chain amino acid ABC transporter permease [Noviherbaspirillum denitrificans]OWW19008.1 ABC transporter permease [Noviherbaspirillum denitrificans]
MDPIILIYAVINGVLLGGIYGGVALGLSLIFGVLRVINFAHGSFLMLAMYASYALWTAFGIHPYAGAVVTVPLLFAFGYFTQAVIIAPLFKREAAMVVEPLGALLLTTGVFLVLDNSVLMTFGPDVRSVSTEFASGSISLLSLPVNIPRMIGCLSALLLAGGLAYWLRHTDMGRAIRATAQNRDAAALSGIHVGKIYNITFGIGAGILGLFGALLVPFLSITPTTGLGFGIKSFLVVVLGGIGSIPGSLLGGILLGVFESVASQFVTATSASVFSFCLFIAVLLVRPNGLLGRK